MGTGDTVGEGVGAEVGTGVGVGTGAMEMDGSSVGIWLGAGDG